MAQSPIRRQFDSVDTLRQVADDLPGARKDGDVLVAHGPNGDEEWDKIGNRTGVVVDGYGAVGAVSASDHFYNVIQFGEPLKALAEKVERMPETSDVSGRVTVNKWGNKMSAMVTFGGSDRLSIAPMPGDIIDSGLRIRTGHTGFQGVKVEVGAQRVICSNGMVAFDSDLEFEHSHQREFNPALIDQAVDGLVDSVDEVEARFKRARETQFRSEDEALLVLMDAGIDQFLGDNAHETLREALEKELGYYDALGATRPETPTLYDAYNAATHAISNMADLDGHVRDAALERASALVDQFGQVPTADDLAVDTIESRTTALTSEEGEERFEGEREVVREAAQARAV